MGKNIKTAIGIPLLSACLAIAASVSPVKAHTLSLQPSTVRTLKVPQVQPTQATLRSLTGHCCPKPPFFHRQEILQASKVTSTRTIQHTYLLNSSKPVKTVDIMSDRAVAAFTRAAKSKSKSNSLLNAGNMTIPTSTSGAIGQINAVFASDWASWTGSSNGTLTLSTLAGLLTNPKLTGAQAAVLGMLANQMYSDIDDYGISNPSYSLADAKAYVLGTSSNGNAIFDGYGVNAYISALSQVCSSTNKNGTFNLYGTYKLPELAKIQQGELGDCFFVSAVNSVLNQNPKLIASMITQSSNGTFTVRFPNGQEETVALTDSEIAAFSQSKGNGCWLAVLGMAEDTILDGDAPNYGPTNSPLGVISGGGWPVQTLGMLTGKSYDAITFGNITSASLCQLLQTDLATKTPIGVESYDHALSIIGFNAKTQMVTIKNPWGVSCNYGEFDDPGILNSGMDVHMNAGVFTISLSSMVSDFYSVTAPDSLLNALGVSPLGLAQSVTLGSAQNMSINSGSVPGAAPQSAFGTSVQATALAPHTVAQAATKAASNQSPSSGSLFGGSNLALLKVSALHAEVLDSAIAHSLITNGTSEQSTSAGQGSMLVMSDKPAQIHTARATVEVAAHAAALIVQIGDEVAVGNLSDKHLGDVAINFGDKCVNVPMGKVVLLSAKDVNDPHQIQVSDCVDGQQTFVLGKYADTNAFTGRLSYIWAIKNCPQFRELAHSDDAGKRKVAMQVIKAGAAVMTLAQGG